jgi:phosphoglycolate phosphatase-like HAD superfamily hydrolase
MRSLRLAELRELVQGAAFSAWWADWSQAVAALAEARARHEDLLAQAEMMSVRSELAQRAAVEAFSRAGEAEDGATRSAAEAQGLENKALGLVGEYEEQRFRTSDLWVRLGGAEKGLEERHEAAGKPAGKGARARASGEAALQAAARQVEALREAYEAEDRKRTRLWDEVEGAWAGSFERSLLGAELGVASRRVRREAERLFEEAEERRVRAKQLAADAEAAGRARRDAERRRAGLLADARERFGCAPGELFLYWRHADDKRGAFALALADDAESTNVEVKALRVYAVGRARGAAFLEPARDGLAPTAEEGDRRFEEYFLGPRKGARRDDEAEPPPEGAGKP